MMLLAVLLRSSPNGAVKSKEPLRARDDVLELRFSERELAWLAHYARQIGVSVNAAVRIIVRKVAKLDAHNDDRAEKGKEGGQ
jgi:hypothetical protein